MSIYYENSDNFTPILPATYHLWHSSTFAVGGFTKMANRKLAANTMIAIQ